MKSLSAITMALLLVTGLTVLGCSPQMSGQGDAGWITLLDGSNPKTLDNWNRIGDANWRVEDGAVVADKGKGGHLVSKNSYKDFQIRAEFWADHTTNSGIFIRDSDPKNVSGKSAYEVNINDQRPDTGYGTGGHPQCREGIAQPQGRRQMEQLRDNGQRSAADSHAERDQDRGYPKQPISGRPYFPPVWQP